MDIIKIVYISSIVIPFIFTIGIMVFVRTSIRKRIENERKLKAENSDKEHLIRKLEEAVENQDNILEAYRDRAT